MQFEKILQSKDNAVKMPVFYIALATIVMVFLLIFIIGYHYDNKERHNRSIFKYSVKLCIFMLVIHNSILSIPIFQLIFNMIICQAASIYCMNSGTCYQGLSLLNAVFGVLTLLLFLIEISFFNLFVNEMNPVSKLPSASFNLNQNLLKMLYKLFLSLFSVMDYTGEYRQYVVIGASLILLVNVLVFRFNFPPLYNTYVHFTSLFIDTLLFYSYLIMLIQIVVPPSHSMPTQT